MTFTELILKLLPFLTFVADIGLGLALIYFITLKIILGKNLESNNLFAFIKKNAIFLAFMIALIATTGSLFYSEIAGYTPCKLCWYQRIFMYPLSIILLISLIKKDNTVNKYVIPLSVIGGIISIIHYWIQMASNVTSCGLDGTSCTTTYSFSYGYITIPIMALTAFIMIIIFCIISSKDSAVSWEGF